MKKVTHLILLIFVLLIWTTSSWGQVNNYTFTQSVGTYTTVTAGTQLIAALTDDGSSAATNIGFDFVFNGATFTQFVANSNGSIRLGSSAPTSPTNPISTVGNTNAIAFFARDGKTGGAVVYEVSGSAPNRVLTIEYPGFYPSYLSTTTYISAQIKLYETTNAVELVYGSSTRASSYTAQLGIRGSSAATDFINRTTTTNWAATVAGATSSATMTLSSTVFPASGLTFKFAPPVPCEGTPTPGNTIATPASVCSGVNFALSLQNSTPGSGVTYQWQSSATGSDPWTNFGASTASVTTSQIAATWYRCQVTCSGNTGTSNLVQVAMNPWINCYCLPTYSSGGGTDGMTLVVLGTLSQATVGNVSPYYYNYTTTQNAIPDLSQGTSANLMITFGADGQQWNGVWVDFNQSGSFETTEFFTSGTNAGASGTATVVIAVPLGANLGNTRMRLRSSDSQPLSSQACGATSSPWGQAQDYFVNITPPPPCVPPSGLAADNMTTNSAELSWVENGTATAWNIEYGLKDFMQGEGTLIEGVTDNPFLLEGLESATFYDFYVQADCGTKALSPWVGPVTFFTECDLYAIPFAESFDGELFPPLCWSRSYIAGSGTGLWDRQLTGSFPTCAPHSGAAMARFNCFGFSEGTIGILTTPAIDVTNDALAVTFWMYRDPGYTTDADLVNVYYNTNPGLTGATLVGTVNRYMGFAPAVTTEGWYQYIFKSPAGILGDVGYFVFEGVSSFGNNIFIDDVSVDVPPPPGFLSGIVIDQTTSLPLGGVEVVTTPGGATATTNPSGWYEIELEQGTYSATFSKADYFTQTNSGKIILPGAITTLNVILGPIPPPYCADLVSPADGASGLLPNISLNWTPSAGSPPALGYRIQLFNLTTEVWLEGDELIGTDLGNVTTYTPAVPFEWGCNYVWLIIPYNNAGSATDCIPWYFTVTSFGNISGLVKNTSTGLPVDGVTVNILQTFPNTGYTFNAVSAADGKWNIQLPVGIFKLTYSKFGYFAKTINNVSVFANQTTNQTVTLDPVTPYNLPFVENWNTGTFNTQKWSVVPPIANWLVVTLGNPSPAAGFIWGSTTSVPPIPSAVNYSNTLTSYNINGVGAAKVYAQFDLFLQNFDWSTFETMTFMVFDGAQWNDIETFDNQGGLNGSIPWTTLTYDITQYAAGHQFLLGFKAEGEDSYNIDWWLIDNILVTTSIMEVSPPSIADALFAGQTSQFPVTIQNNGNRPLFWSAEVVPPSPWVTLGMTNGVTPVGSESFNVTLDAGALTAGVYEAQLIITAGGGTLQQTTTISLKVFEGPGQKIMIPEPNSWGYISSYINLPAKAPLEDVLADIVDEMVIMLGDNGIFWPVQGINTIGDWNNAEGYKLKMGGDGALIIPGMPVTNKIAHFTQGIHIIPVLSTGQIATAVIFNNKPVVFAFSLDGKIYWPAGGITDLKYLVPGYGYLVKFSADCDLNFGGTKGEEIPYIAPVYTNNTTWNNVSRTGDVHIIGISGEACSELIAGDVLGAFNLDGLCVGMTEYSGNGEPFAIVTYADDNTTTKNDGMNVGELITIKAFRNGEEVILNPVYNAAMPNADGLFAINGLSQISNFKESSLAVGGKVMDNIKIYPNPSSGIFNINLTGISNPIRISVTNSQGQLIYSGQISGSQQLDLTDQPNGVYFVRLVNENSVRLEKLIIK